MLELFLSLRFEAPNMGSGMIFYVLRTHANTSLEDRLRLADLMVLSRDEDLIYQLSPQDPHPAARYHRSSAETLYEQQIEGRLMAVRHP